MAWPDSALSNLWKALRLPALQCRDRVVTQPPRSRGGPAAESVTPRVSNVARALSAARKGGVQGPTRATARTAASSLYVYPLASLDIDARAAHAELSRLTSALPAERGKEVI